MPGVQSLRLQQYYAHPQNQFWRILFTTFGISQPEDYDRRICFLLEHGIALWDVLEACVRDGSLDVSITKGSERPNNLAKLLRAHIGISTVAFNGGKSYDLFQRLIAPTLADLGRSLKAIQMPSTIPAHTLNIERKIEQWRAVLIEE
jgi:double-stranded uracil-DNA glycosylase